MSQFVSYETERVCLAALLKDNKQIPNITAFIKPDHFVHVMHQTLFNLIVSSYQDKGIVDDTIVITKSRAMGLNEIDGIDINSYLYSLKAIPVNEDYVTDYFRELYKYYTLRKCYKSLGNAQKFISANLEKPIQEIIPNIEKMFNDALTINVSEDVDFVDLYGDMEDEITRRADLGIPAALKTPYPVFEKWYGGLYFGDMYVFAAPAKKGKSTFLNYTAYEVAKNPMNNCKVLYLDTELESWRVQCRSAAALTDVNEYYYKTGKFKDNPIMVKKANDLWNKNHDMKGRVTHVYVANKNIDDIISICRRWYSRFVKKGEAALIVYDYMKITGETISGHNQEYHVMGEKCDRLKKLSSDLPLTTVLTAIQVNAQGDIAMSQRIKWFASNVYRLDPKTIDEINQDGKQYGSHKLIEVATRNQGEEAKGMNNLVKVQLGDGKIEWKQNFINFDFNNFKVTEVGTYEEVLSAKAQQLDLEEGDEYDSVNF